MTREEALALAAPFSAYADCVPTVRGDDLYAYALLIESLVYSREAKEFADKSFARDVRGLDVADKK